MCDCGRCCTECPHGDDCISHDLNPDPTDHQGYDHDAHTL